MAATGVILVSSDAISKGKGTFTWVGLQEPELISVVLNQMLGGNGRRPAGIKDKYRTIKLEIPKGLE